MVRTLETGLRELIRRRYRIPNDLRHKTDDRQGRFLSGYVRPFAAFRPVNAVWSSALRPPFFRGRSRPRHLISHPSMKSTRTACVDLNCPATRHTRYIRQYFPLPPESRLVISLMLPRPCRRVDVLGQKWGLCTRRLGHSLQTPDQGVRSVSVSAAGPAALPGSRMSHSGPREV